MPASPTSPRPAARAADAIHFAFFRFQHGFNAITGRTRLRYENRDWRGMQHDAVERLDLYSRILDEIVAQVRELLGEPAASEEVWREIKGAYASKVADDPNSELAETFFNSVTRRIFSTVGVNPDIEFVSLDSAIAPREPDPSVYERYTSDGDTRGLIERILEDYRFEIDYRDLTGDSLRVAEEVGSYLESLLGSSRIDGIETLKTLFYRNKGAYIIGRIRTLNQVIPLVLPLLHLEDGIAVDTALFTENEVSILFSFTRSYFHVQTTRPRELIIFLKSIMPLKPIAELYIALGLNRHGKTELYRSLQRYLRSTTDRFEIAEGDRGMVMIVFTLPFYDVVFKVIRDRFDYPKTATRKDVMERYRLVFKRDRVGRLVDAQEYEHLKFRKERFSEKLLEELTRDASQTVRIEGDHVVIQHLYTERKLTPLNLYLRRAGERSTRAAIIDYGHANKDLAAANIFPGDFLLKNFGVTRHGRVVFYDYDELCLVTDCNFRRLPPPRNPDEELEAETWFRVDENDIFPEEFIRFLEFQDPLRDLFLRHHGDLFTVEFWRGLKERHLAGEVLDVFPYPQSKRFGWKGPGAGPGRARS